MLGYLSDAGPAISALANADEIKRPNDREKDPRNIAPAPDLFSQPRPANDHHANENARATAAAMPKGRNFH